jgi:FKBP-type peptidyl-prolyl cis-trans isomerase SlyD
MKVGEEKVVAIEYTAKLDSGEVVEGKEKPAHQSFIFGKNQVFPALEKKLRGLGAGDTTNVTLTPQESFGSRKTELMKKVPLSQFPSDLKVEPGYMYQTRDSSGKPRFFSIREKNEETALLDFNHPLAGENLHFEITIIDVRPATSEELTSPSST